MAPCHFLTVESVAHIKYIPGICKESQTTSLTLLVRRSSFDCGVGELDNLKGTPAAAGGGHTGCRVLCGVEGLHEGGREKASRTPHDGPLVGTVCF